MKKLILAGLVTVGILAVQAPKAEARDNGGGAVVAGFIAGAVIADALHPHNTVYVSQPAPCAAPAPTVVYAPAPTYCPPAPVRVVYAPAPPVVVYRQPVVRVGFGWGRYDYRHDRRDDRRDDRHDRRDHNDRYYACR